MKYISIKKRSFKKQMQTGVYKIKNNNNFGTDFFVKILFHNDQYLMPKLLTNNHVLSQKDLGPDKAITFSI